MSKGIGFEVVIVIFRRMLFVLNSECRYDLIYIGLLDATRCWSSIYLETDESLFTCLVTRLIVIDIDFAPIESWVKPIDYMCSAKYHDFHWVVIGLPVVGFNICVVK